MTYYIRKEKLLIFLALLGGLLYRIFLLIKTFSHIDSDQATTGLMALHILKNQETPFFYYGLQYQGAFDVYMTVPFISIFGMQRWILHVIPLVISIVFIYVTYLVGKNCFSHQVGIYSALYAAFPPVLLNIRGLCADADYIMIVVVGSISLLLFHSYGIIPCRWKAFCIFLLFIFGIWVHPIMLYYVIAISVLWIIRIFKLDNNSITKPRKLVIVIYFLSVIVFCTILFYIFNSRNQLILIAEYLKFITIYSLPVMLGFVSHISMPNDWGVYTEIINNSIISFEIFIVGLIAIIFLCTCYKLIKAQPLFPIFSILTLFIFSATASILKIQLGFIYYPRYLIPLYSAIPLLIYSLFLITRGSTSLRPILIGILLVINLIGNLYFKTEIPPYQLLDWLMQRPGTQYVYTDYWIGYWLAYESEEKIIPYAIGENNDPGFNRYQPYVDMVEKSTDALYIYKEDDLRGEQFRANLIKSNCHFKLHKIGGYLVYEDLTKKYHFPTSTFSE